MSGTRQRTGTVGGSTAGGPRQAKGAIAMRHFAALVAGRMVLVSFDPGEDYPEGRKAALARHGVAHGVALSTAATFARWRLHQVPSLWDVADQRTLSLDGPIGVTGVSGVVVPGQPHLHATVADRDDKAYGGQLEPDCPVPYLAQAAVLALDALAMARTPGADGIDRLRG